MGTLNQHSGCRFIGVGCELDAVEWAVEQYQHVDLGDWRLNKRAVEIAKRMAAQPEASLLEQMGGRAALEGCYRLLNNERVGMEALLAPHCRHTLDRASQLEVVLMVEDASELDYTTHRSTKGLGPIGNKLGRGMLLHSTMAVAPEGRQVLGLAHVQVVVREPISDSPVHRRHTAEGQVWEVSAQRVGRPPEGITWVHVSDRDSDIFDYMVTCVDLGKHFLVRAYQKRVLVWDDEVVPAMGEQAHTLLDYVRSLPPQAERGYSVEVSARKDQPAREARVVLQWAAVKIGPGSHTVASMRHHLPLLVWLLRVWEPDPPAKADAVEWVLLSSLPITTIAEAHRAVDWYSCRWLIEDYHQCLKTGCQIERSQLDDGADIQRLLGSCCPIAARLLQLRQFARQKPELPAVEVVEPLLVKILTMRRQGMTMDMPIAEFWRAVAGLGGYLGRRGDGPPGWRTIWRGWRKLSDLAEGARLFVPTAEM